jgi:putative transposase
MPIGIDTYGYRGDVPHLVKSGKSYFVTFCTIDRWILPPVARDITIRSCIHDHGALHWLHCVTVMPDHVHLITTPYDDVWLDEVIGAMKSASSHIINRLLGHRGHVWLSEGFDHILRSDESLVEKAEYIGQNPVRAGLVREWQTWVAEYDDNDPELARAPVTTWKPRKIRDRKPP